MSHDIHHMAYVGEEPWHGLGTQLPTSSTYEEVVQAAGFYTAVERPLYSPPMEEPIPDRKGLFRDDTGEYLATVHKGYEVVQFEEVARTLVEAAGGVGAIFHTAGTLGRNGVRGWLLGELPEPLRVRGDKSPIRRYVLGYTGHDGGTAITLKNVATRVVCQNTIGVALNEQDGAEWHIPHFDNAKQRLEGGRPGVPGAAGELRPLRGPGQPAGRDALLGGAAPPRPGRGAAHARGRGQSPAHPPRAGEGGGAVPSGHRHRGRHAGLRLGGPPSVTHLLDQRARARRQPPPLQGVLSDDPRIHASRVTPHSLADYDTLLSKDSSHDDATA